MNKSTNRKAKGKPRNNKPHDSGEANFIKGLNDTGEVIGGIADITVGKVGKGVSSVISGGLKGMWNWGNAIIKGIKHVVNDKDWYLRKGTITPAANISRPMNPTSNIDIVQNPTMGSVPRIVDVMLTWPNYADSDAFKMATLEAYKNIRIKLQSNLPYSQKKLEAYFINAVTTAIAIQSRSRDMTWINQTVSDFPEFSSVLLTRVDNLQGYGVVEATLDPEYTPENLPTTIAQYDKLAAILPSGVKLPKQLLKWIAHYAYSLFVDAPDGFATQFFRTVWLNLPVAHYDQDTDTYTVSATNISNWTINDLIQWVVEFATDNGKIIADAEKHAYFDSLYVTPFNKLQAAPVYDASFEQAMMNAYTSKSGVTDDGYVRFDYIDGDTDMFTTFLFNGALKTSAQTGATPAIVVGAMVIKMANDAKLQWPGSMFQDGVNNVSLDFKYVGIIFCTDVTVTANTNVSTSTVGVIPSQGTATSDYSSVAINTVTSEGYNLLNFRNGVVYKATNANTLAYLPMFLVAVDGQNTITGLEYTLKFNTDKTAWSITNIAYVAWNYGDNGYADSQLWYAASRPSYVRATVGGGVETALQPSPAVDRNNNLTGLYIHTLDTAGAYFQQVGSIASESKYMLTTFSQLGNVVSFQRVSVSLAAAAVTTSTVLGYSGLVPWVVDVVDHHLPIVLNSNIRVKVNSSGMQVIPVGKQLIKEEYIPFFYNTQDLEPVWFRMFYSLFSI